MRLQRVLFRTDAQLVGALSYVRTLANFGTNMPLLMASAATVHSAQRDYDSSL